MGCDRQSDFARAHPISAAPVAAGRRLRGTLACVSGHLAEESVARLLESRGISVVARRWRGKAGEIDLICRDREGLIFVEVKQSDTHQAAAERLGRAQQRRIMQAALEYCEQQGQVMLPELRFDAALVDRQGRIEILEAAFVADFC